MRILHILDHSIPLHSGYTFRTLSILKAQRALGWETFQLTSTKQGISDLLEETIDGWHFFRTPSVTRFIDKLPILNQLSVINSLSQRLNEVIEIVKPDILHAHSPVLNAMSTLQAGRRFHIPVVYEVRAFWEDAAVDHGTNREWGIRYRLTRALESLALHRADAVTTICDGLRNDILSRGLPARKITTIPNAVDIEAFSVGNETDEVLKNQLGLNGKRILGFIGSFYAYEGLEILLRALPVMLSQYPDLRVLLVGGGPQDTFLRQLSKELAIQDKVIFTGRVPHEHIKKYYDLIEILIYPRLSMRLTELVTPLKPLEAMAQGRLLVASDVGGHLELIRDGETGMIFKAGDAQSLAGTVSALLSSPQRWPALQQAGRDFVEKERNWRISVAKYESIYEQLLASQGKTD